MISSISDDEIENYIKQAADGADDRILRGSPVGWSPDMARIQALPRRTLDLKDPRAAAAWTKHLRLERTTPCDCVARWGFCITDFNEVQGWTLEEAMDASGVVCSITVGGGKTGNDIFLPMAIPGVKVAVLIVPAGLKSQLLKKDWPQWSAHFKTPNLAKVEGYPQGSFVPGRPVVHIYSYNEVSNRKKSDLFRRLGKIDLVIADECQGLADRTTVTTTRYLSLWDHNPKAHAAVQSGTLTKKSIRDHAHLDVLCLGNKAPVPHAFQVVEEWAALLDPGKFVCPTGEFAKFMKPGESARDGFARRFTETFGIIATSDTGIGTSLTITERVPNNVPQEIGDAIEETIKKNERPDGEELLEEMEVEIVTRQIAAGFYYRWAFKESELPLVKEWRTARKAFFKELRGEMASQRVKENYDSPYLITKAAQRWHEGYTFHEHTGHKHTPECRAAPTAIPHEHSEECRVFCDFEWDTVPGELICGQQPGPVVKHVIEKHTRKGPQHTWASEFWPAWEAVRKNCHPVTQPVWINDFLVRDAAAWLTENRGIAWFEFVEFGHAVANMAKVPYYGGGEAASAEIIEEKGNRSIVASIKAHGTGKNLQHAFSKNLVMNPPSDGAIWEQLIGRTHRRGQPADTVTVELYRHTLRWRKAFETARRRALYIQQTLKNPQRLCFATYDLVE